jgi:peptidoglycan/xylan/chitin deacetylase (PgdA/CDA1 family)
MKLHHLGITIDVEDWYHIPSVTGSPFSQFSTTDEFFEKWDGRYDYLTESTKKVLNLLDDSRVHATFFVVAEVLEHYRGLVESIVEHGHEIACHGMHHACKIDPHSKLPLMTVEDFEKRTLKAKHMIEMVSGQKVTGYRAPNAMVTGWMIDSLEKIGFTYDSSVSKNSLFNKSDSPLHTVSSYPYYPVKGSLEQGEPRKILEFPWAFYQIGGVKIPSSGGPVLRFFGTYIVLSGLLQSLKRGHTVLYFHPIDLCSEPFPRIGKGRPFYWALKGEIIEKRLRRILNSIRSQRIPISPLGKLREQIS